MTQLLSALALGGGLVGATMAACGGRSPGEMPPVAPQPEPVRPNAMPMTGAVSARAPAAQPSPVYQAAADSQAVGDQPAPAPPSGGAALDAGVSDSGDAPLPPLPDGDVPADSRMEPIVQRDGGR